MKLPIDGRLAPLVARRNRTDAAICAQQIEPDAAEMAERYSAELTIPVICAGDLRRPGSATRPGVAGRGFYSTNAL